MKSVIAVCLLLSACASLDHQYPEVHRTQHLYTQYDLEAEKGKMTMADAVQIYGFPKDAQVFDDNYILTWEDIYRTQWYEQHLLRLGFDEKKILTKATYEKRVSDIEIPSFTDTIVNVHKARNELKRDDIQTASEELDLQAKVTEMKILFNSGKFTLEEILYEYMKD